MTEPEDKATDDSASEKRGLEDKLDEFADKFSKAMLDGVKRMESAFDKGAQSIKENPDLSKEKVKGFFGSSTGGLVLVLAGIIWFFFTVGILDKPIFPIILLVIGIYVLYRSRTND